MKCVSQEALNLIANSNKSYIDAEGYPHIVIDNFLNEKYLWSSHSTRIIQIPLTAI